MNKIIYDKDAEDALIYSITVQPGEFYKLDISADDFYIAQNKVIWEAFTSLSRTGTEIDVISLNNWIRTNKNEDYFGYIVELSNNTPLADSKHCAEIVREKAKRRHMVQISSKIATAAFDDTTEIDKVLPGFINQLADTQHVQNGAIHLKNYLSRLYNEVEERSNNPTEVWGLQTSFQTFNRITGGLQLGESMIVSGVPGVGKSIWAMQLGVDLGKSNPGAIYSMEMGGLQTTRRIVSGEARINTRQLKTGKLENWAGFVSCIETLGALPIYMSDSVGWTTTSLRADLSRLKAQHDIKWFVLDYLYLLNDSGKDEIERTANISIGIKRICKELNIAGIVIHSMNKAGMENDMPDQSNLRGSGQAVYDADLIVFLKKFTPMKYEKVRESEKENLRTLIFGKGRELEDPQRFIHFTKFQGFPAFAEAALD